MSLIKFLNNLGDAVDEKIDNVNFGGCCVFAAIVAARLATICPTRIVVACPHDYWDDDVTIEKARHYVQSNSPTEWNDAGVEFGHVIVEFDYECRTWHYDSAGVTRKLSRTNTFDFPIVDGFLSIKEACELASYPDWNNRFDRSQIPEMAEVINKQFDGFSIEA